MMVHGRLPVPSCTLNGVHSGLPEMFNEGVKESKIGMQRMSERSKNALGKSRTINNNGTVMCHNEGIHNRKEVAINKETEMVSRRNVIATEIPKLQKP